jgi:hypothetical protein
MEANSYFEEKWMPKNFCYFKKPSRELPITMGSPSFGLRTTLLCLEPATAFIGSAEATAGRTAPGVIKQLVQAKQRGSSLTYAGKIIGQRLKTEVISTPLKGGAYMEAGHPVKPTALRGKGK